jgi:hypothetical protein
MVLNALRAILFLFVFASPTYAQKISVYGTYSALHLTDATYSTSYFLNGSTTTHNTSGWSSGFTIGATLDLISFGPIELGADLRGSPVKIGTPGVSDFLAGLKLSAKLPVAKLKPYVQASGGKMYINASASTTNAYGYGPGVINTCTSTTTQNVTAVELMAGVDYPLTHFIDLRLFEIGFGRAASSPFSSHNQGVDHTLFPINTGLVLHF